jgi:uncharacterized phiE125 gp8 family phage protein
VSDLCTLPEAKTHLNISTSATDAELAAFLTVASDLVEEKADRVWRDTTYTEYHTGGTSDIVLFHSPVKSITSVIDDGSTIAPSAYTLIPETGLIHLDDNVFRGERYEVVVTYVAGAAAIPPLVKQATLETVRHLWQTQRGTVARNPLNGDDIDARSTFSLPMRAIELIDKLSFHGGIG